MVWTTLTWMLTLWPAILPSAQRMWLRLKPLRNNRKTLDDCWNMHAAEGKEEEEMRLLSAQQNLHTTVGLEKRRAGKKSRWIFATQAIPGQGIQQLTGYKSGMEPEKNASSLPDRLNNVFNNNGLKEAFERMTFFWTDGQTSVVISAADTRRTLARINPRKVAGPDNLREGCLRHRAGEPAAALTDIFNNSFCQAILPVPSCVNDSSNCFDLSAD